MKSILYLPAILLALCSNSAFIQAESRPNVILVMSDDQGYGDLGCHGNPWIQTPNIDQLYKQSVRLTDFHVDTICSPTRAALMTGQVAGRVGVSGTLGGKEIVHAGEIMMPEVFADSGYRTAMFGKWHLGDHYPFRPADRGFEHVFWHKGGGLWQASDHWNNDYFNDTYLLNGEAVQYEGYCTDVWFGEAMKYIEEHREEPFFCYIPTNAPHGPYLVDKKYYDLYNDNSEVVKPEFYGMITNLDENMGRLMQRLRELDLEENTILIFMTDNGMAGAAAELDEQGFVLKGYNAGMRGTKAHDYEGGHRVPFFIRWPKGGITGGRDIHELTAHIDVMETLIDLCGLQRPEENPFEGISLAPLLRGESMKMPERTLFGRSNPKKWRGVVLNGKWRLVKGAELYDVEADPSQKQDVSEKHPEVVERLRADYDAYHREASEALNAPKMSIVGSDEENPMHLSSVDWDGTSGVWSQTHVRRGLRKRGYWLIDVERAGSYEISLRRWPVEADLPIAAGCPKHPMEAENCWSGTWPEGVALPIRHAQLKIADLNQTKFVAEDAASVTFEVELEKGPNRLEGVFLGEDKQVLCGAYYASVELKGAVASAAAWPGKASEWMGFRRFDFPVDGRDCFVIVPKIPAAGNPWVWRARFPKYHSEVDALLAERGIHVAYMNTDTIFVTRVRSGWLSSFRKSRNEGIPPTGNSAAPS